MSDVPRSVLFDALQKALDGATLRAAVMTTFALEWSFTLDEVLPAFVPGPLSAAPNARREELADHLLGNGASITLYFDAAHPGDFERATRVPVALVPVRHPTGHFHPKVVCALVEGGGRERLVVAAGSANLTRASWWAWVECAHVVVIEAGARTWLRDDLLGFLGHLRTLPQSGVDRRAEEQVRTFLRATTQATPRPSAEDGDIAKFVWNGRGGDGLVRAVERVVGDWYVGGTLEVISPWYSDDGDKVLRRLIKETGVADVLVAVPSDPDGRSLLPPEAVRRLGEDVAWASLPDDVVSSGSHRDAKPRHVHAKVYRFRKSRRPEQTVVIGSFNLTQAAFSGGGNVEAGFVVDLYEGGKEPWLTASATPSAFAERPADEGEESLPQSHPSPLSLSCDWQERSAVAAWAGHGAAPGLRATLGPVEVLGLPSGWESGPLAQSQAEGLFRHLTSSSPFLSVIGVDGEDLGYTVVTERNVMTKPSGDVDRQLSDAVADLLLDAEGRRGRREKGGSAEEDDPLAISIPEADAAMSSVFDGHAALYQGLAALKTQLRTLGEEGRDREIEYRLVGEGARCLGDLLTRAKRGAGEGPAMSLVVCWGVDDVLDALEADLPDHQSEVDRVRRRTTKLRTSLETQLAHDNADDEKFQHFLEWARTEFLGGATS